MDRNGIYVLTRTREGVTENVAAFTDEIEADEWAEVLNDAENRNGAEPSRDEFGLWDPLWEVELVPVDDDVVMRAVAADRGAEEAEWRG